LSEEVLNKSLIDKLLFSPDVRKNIMADLNIKSTYVFNNLLTALRNKGVITRDNKIAEVLIPNFIPGSDNFKLVFNFEVNDSK
jgi:SOS-response transcriptional repressor LexA